MIVILFTMLLFILVAGYAIKKSSKKEYILDKNLNGVVAGLSAGATQCSGFAVFAIVGLGYVKGLSSFTYIISAVIGQAIFWFFISKRVVKESTSLKAISVPELLTEGFADSKLKKLFIKYISIISIFGLSFYLIAQFASIEKAMVIFTNADPLIPMLIILAIIIGYSSIGGFAASVYTDVLQSLLMAALIIVMMVWLAFNFGDFNTLLLQDYYSTSQELTSSWYVGIFISWMFMGFIMNVSQPQMIVRLMSIKDQKQNKKARIVFFLFYSILSFSAIIIGICARAIFPEISDPEMSIPLIANAYLPPFLLFIVLMGLISAIVSTLDSLIVSISNTLSYDILGFGKKAEHKLIVNKIIMLAVGLVATYVSFMDLGTIFKLVLFGLNILFGSVAVALILKLFVKDLKLSYMFVSVIIGTILTIVWKIYSPYQYVSEGMVGFFSGVLFYFILEKAILVKNSYKNS